MTCTYDYRIQHLTRDRTQWSDERAGRQRRAQGFRAASPSHPRHRAETYGDYRHLELMGWLL